MKKAGVLKKDWFIALLVSVLFIVAFGNNIPLLDRFEQLAYDVGVRMTHRNPAAADDIAIIAIDDPSITQIGRWPWPRSVLAEMLQRLSKAKAREIGLLISFTEPQTDPGLKYIRQLKNYVRKTPFPKNARREARAISKFLTQAEHDLNSDAKLSKTLTKVQNIYMPMFFKVGAPLAKPSTKLPGYVRRNRLTKVINDPDNIGAPFATEGVRFPLEYFGRYTAGIGHLNLLKDQVGGIRSETLVLEHYGEYYPSLALLLAARRLNLGPRGIKVELGKGVRLGRLYIKTNPRMQMYAGFYASRANDTPFTTYSFKDVHAGKVSRKVFRNKIVLIGATAAGAGVTHVTPTNPSMSSPELTANIITSILNQDFYTRPSWAIWAEAGMFAVIVFYLMLILPRMSTGFAAAFSFLLLLALIGAGHYLMVSEKIWLRSVSPALLLLAGHLLLTTKRFFTTERLKLAAESDSAHTNRLLGLAFQGQGQLDMALDKFRKLSVDESVLELIYNLALDFERKRHFNKAVAAYHYILTHDRKFRDVSERMKRARQAENTILLGSRAVTANGTVILDGLDQKPTLGRYELEKELGRGAMGTVYLGRDPKINRVVAIKTLALSQEFEETEVKQVMERFFREAETAGRLNHPNIVTIYDAGEEHDLAYIAMEYLQGKDLTHYINKEKPLSLSWVMNVIVKVADALDYAHKQNVVHRDIKPANIMFNEADNSIKVTDFGIARITASSKTKTGVVLGTPSYMSPEQLAGKPVDGRSDLFSLGVTLFELLTGKQPFTGDSMAALMYQITNVKHPNVKRLRKDVPPCVRTILDRLLHKKPGKRYQSGDELKRAVAKCIGSSVE